MKSINDFTSEKVEIEIKCPSGVEAEKMVDALYAFTDCEVTIASRIVVIKDNRPVELTVSEVLRENTEQLVSVLKRELELSEQKLEDELHFRTLERIFIEERIYKAIEKCKTNEAVISGGLRRLQAFQAPDSCANSPTRTWSGFCRFASAGFRCSTSTSIGRKWRGQRPTSTETRKNLKNLTRYVIGHLESLLEKYGPQLSAPDHEIRAARRKWTRRPSRSRRSKSPTTARAVTWVTRSTATNSRWSAPSLTRFCSCSRTAPTRSASCRRRLFVGPELFYCGLPDRERVFTCAYTDRKASYLKRFKFGGTILNKVYLCIPDKSRILFFAPDTPKILYVRYKPAPHQKIHQQTCDPRHVEVKSPKTRGRMISIKDISSVTAEPTRGWDEKETTTTIDFT